VALLPPDDSTARAQPLAGMPGVRWNRNKGIYPTSLRRYLECPRRCRLEYIDQVRYERPWDRAMEVGNALHKLMERIGNTLKRRQAPAPTVTFRGLVESLLPEREYADSQIRAADIDDVLHWAAVGETYINDGDAQVLIVEHYDPRRWVGQELGSVMLGAKADVVIRRRDADGPYLEIVDYKTGRTATTPSSRRCSSRIALSAASRRRCRARPSRASSSAISGSATARSTGAGRRAMRCAPAGASCIASSRGWWARRSGRCAQARTPVAIAPTSISSASRSRTRATRPASTAEARSGTRFAPPWPRNRCARR